VVKVLPAKVVLAAAKAPLIAVITVDPCRCETLAPRPAITGISGGPPALRKDFVGGADSRVAAGGIITLTTNENVLIY
jgi:hypothetical protein